MYLTEKELQINQSHQPYQRIIINMYSLDSVIFKNLIDRLIIYLFMMMIIMMMMTQICILTKTIKSNVF